MTIHRALGFVDRAALTDESPLRVVMASEGRQADGIDLRMSGADLARFRANPVLGYGHSYYGRANLPIGRVDPGTQEFRGDMPYEPGRCECAHLVTFHVINSKGQRAACSRSDCACRRYVEAEAGER